MHSGQHIEVSPRSVCHGRAKMRDDHHAPARDYRRDHDRSAGSAERRQRGYDDSKTLLGTCARRADINRSA